MDKIPRYLTLLALYCYCRSIPWNTTTGFY